MRHAALPFALGLLFSACGKLDLGGYGAAAPSPIDDNPVGVQPAAPSSGAGGVGAAEPIAAGGSLAEAGEAGNGSAAGAADDSQEPSSAGATGDAGATSEADPFAGKRSSCRYLPDLCGNPLRSCCAASLVPSGEFVVGGLNPDEPSPIQSHVSSFYLGEFEVTVGRFQAFLSSYDSWHASGLKAGAGRQPLIPGSGWDPAWSRAPNDPPEKFGIAAKHRDIEDEVTTCLEIPFSTVMWSQPVNCVSFYEAAAFCIWDGGRLPTDLEWEYAAAGGGQNRVYPWGADEPVENLAMFGCSANLPFKTCMIPPVGSYPAGAGRFGQFDLAGSVEEWTLDAVGNARPSPCNDCASVEQLHPDDPRVTHGGNWTSDADSLRVANGKGMQAHWHLPMFGFRCAYDLP